MDVNIGVGFETKSTHLEITDLRQKTLANTQIHEKPVFYRINIKMNCKNLFYPVLWQMGKQTQQGQAIALGQESKPLD